MIGKLVHYTSDFNEYGIALMTNLLYDKFCDAMSILSDYEESEFYGDSYKVYDFEFSDSSVPGLHPQVVDEFAYFTNGYFPLAEILKEAKYYETQYVYVAFDIVHNVTGEVYTCSARFAEINVGGILLTPSNEIRDYYYEAVSDSEFPNDCVTGSIKFISKKEYYRRPENSNNAIWD